jgi:hypothetical protein
MYSQMRHELFQELRADRNRGGGGHRLRRCMLLTFYSPTVLQDVVDGLNAQFGSAFAGAPTAAELFPETAATSAAAAPAAAPSAV